MYIDYKHVHLVFLIKKLRNEIIKFLSKFDNMVQIHDYLCKFQFDLSRPRWPHVKIKRITNKGSDIQSKNGRRQKLLPLAHIYVSAHFISLGQALQLKVAGFI
jgi:hypothetical protein